MGRSPILTWFQFIFVLFFVLYTCEYVVYYLVQRRCNWPILSPHSEDRKINGTPEEPVRILVITDTHLLGVRKSHWLDKLLREWQMYRAFRTALWYYQPEIVFVLGDLTDEGSFSWPEDFDTYVQRFHQLFTVPDDVKIFVTAGNHDVGFHYRTNAYLNQRFIESFNSSTIQMVQIRGNYFVLINSVALEGDGCFLCKRAEEDLQKISGILVKLQCLENSTAATHRGQHCDPSTETYSRPILMQHYPLYRPSDTGCTDFDSGPLWEREEKFRPRWECLSEEATGLVIKKLKPRLVLSGHTHYGCTRQLPHLVDGVEITLSSFSARNTKLPVYGLGMFTVNNYAFRKCPLPDETLLMVVYCFAVISIGFYFYRHHFRRFLLFRRRIA